MKKLIILTIFTAVLCLTNGNTVKVETVSGPPPPEPPPSPSPSTSTTTAPITEPTTTPTTSTTTSTTAAPTTTTTATTTTTVPTTTSTTKAPDTTTASTTVAPTSKPTPKPKPEVQTWVANYTGTNYTCIVMKMALEIEVPYQKTDNKTGNATVVVPITAEATGSCVPNKTEQNLTLTWKKTPEITDSITFTFKKNDTNKKFMLQSVVANIIPDADSFPNASNNNVIIANHTKDEFLTPVAMSYRCKQEEDFILSVPGVNNTGKFIVKNLQIQAFRNATGKDFDSAKDCESGETPGIVPIAVGCSLAALIIIVLIAYLVGRRRSQARGYLSMFSEKQREAEYIPMKNISCFGK